MDVEAGVSVDVVVGAVKSGTAGARPPATTSVGRSEWNSNAAATVDERKTITQAAATRTGDNHLRPESRRSARFVMMIDRLAAG